MTLQKRIGGLGYIHSEADIANALKHIPPRVEQAIAALMNLSVDDWRAQPAKARAKQLVDFQNTGALASTLAHSEEAIAKLEAVALPTIQPTNGDLDLDAIAVKVAEKLHAMGLIVINPSTAQKGA